MFDTHAHLSDPAFDADRDALIAALPQSGVSLVTDVCCDVADWPRTEALIKKYPFIYAAVGMHPHEAAHTTSADLDRVKALLSLDRVKAMGEIGLDYHYDFAPRDVQVKWFAEQLDMAIELSVPVVLHIREAFGDCMDILRARKGRFTGVMHCYSGSLETAMECIDMGLYIAFGGALTFKNAVNQMKNAVQLPLERIVTETDCPYMTPVPLRGKRNDPSLMRLTLERLAGLRGIEFAECEAATEANGRDLFNIN